MANGYAHKVYTFGKQTKGDGIDFGYSTNHPDYDLEVIINRNSKHFCTSGHISKKDTEPITSSKTLKDMDLVARLKIEVNPEHKESLLSVSGSEVYLRVPEDYESAALLQRRDGEDTKTLGSLVLRTIRATSIEKDNLFLHACAIVDTNKKAVYIIISDRDHAGKTPLVNEILRTSKKSGKLLTTALRSKGKFIYPQNHGAEESDKVYTIIREEEEKLFKEEGKCSLLDIGFKREEYPDNYYIGGYRFLTSIKGLEDKIDLSKHKIFCIFASGASITREHDAKLISINKDDAQAKIYDSWLSTWQFKGKKLFDKVSTEDFDKSLRNKYEEKAKEFAKKFTSRIDNFFIYEGTPLNAGDLILVEACKQDFFNYGIKGLEWYHTNTPQLAEGMEKLIRNFNYEKHKQPKLTSYLTEEEELAKNQSTEEEEK